MLEHPLQSFSHVLISTVLLNSLLMERFYISTKKKKNMHFDNIPSYLDYYWSITTLCKDAFWNVHEVDQNIWSKSEYTYILKLPAVQFTRCQGRNIILEYSLKYPKPLSSAIYAELEQ